MFIVSLTYISPLEEIEKCLSEHVEFLDEHYKCGNFQLSGRKVPRTGGVILVTVQDRAALDKILVQDPFYRNGLASYEVIEFVPTKSSQALEFLVEK